MIRFLIDECLSPELATEARLRGFEAVPVVHPGLAGTSDRMLSTQIIGGDFTFVTNNARVILPSARKPDQLRLFAAGLDAIIAAGSDITGELVEVDRDGTVRFRRYPDPLGND